MAPAAAAAPWPMLKGTGFVIQGVNQEVPPAPALPVPLLPVLPPLVLVVLPPPEFPEVELPPPADALPPELPELPPVPPELPELPPAPALPEPFLPVFPAGLVVVLTWVLETLKLASAAVLTFTLGAEVLTTVELDRPLESVLA